MTTGPEYGQVGDRRRLRTSSVDRDHAVALLAKAFVEGRLTKEEHEVRVERALTARSYADLDSVVADLPAPPPPAPRSTRTNALAVASLACGAGQFFTGGLTTIPAVVLGHIARHQIRRTGDQGAGLALAGLILGWAGLVVGLLMAIGIVAAAFGAAAHGFSTHIQIGPGGGPGPGFGPG